MRRVLTHSSFFWIGVIFILLIRILTPLSHTSAQIGRDGIVGVSANENWYAAAYADKSVRVWDATNSQLVYFIPDRTDMSLWSEYELAFYGIYDLAFSPDGNFLAVNYSGNGSVIRVFNMINGNMTLELSSRTYTGDIAWSPDSDQVAARTSSGSGNVY
jgi:WD40 repeat protein